MKVNIEIDMTPDEARKVMGLPDVSKIQDKIALEMQKRIMASLDSHDPGALLKAWLPSGFEPFQKLWESAGHSAARKDQSKPSR